MKIICMCGRDARHEPPFDDFHVERVKCGPQCRTLSAKAEDKKPGISPVLLRPASDLLPAK